MGTTSVLPVEIIELEILTQLPVKSLLRFKSVCKSWNSFISSRRFIKLVRNFNHDSVTLINMHKAIGVTTDDDDYWYCLEVTDIIGCIDGLVCFYNAYQDLMTIIFKIWNPATKQCLEIEPPPKVSDIINFSYGFVFDSVANDYKIMCVKPKGQEPGYIFSCSGRCWRKITPSNIFYHGRDMYSRPFMFNGSVFWLVTQTHDRQDRLTVISFDVLQETFRLLPDLGEFERSHNGRYSMFVKFRDSLAIMFYNSTLFAREETIDIFIFNERCENWSKTSIGPFKFWNGEPIVNSEPKFLGCFNNSDILFLYPKTINNKYYVNLQNYTIKSLGKGDLFEDYMYGLTNYSESLVFIDGMKPSSGTEDEIRYYYLRKE